MAVIIHHTDADGWCGAAVCAKYISEMSNEPIKFIPFNYSDIDIDKIDRGERTICVDTSLNKNKESLDQWIQVFEKSMNVLFIDHHQSTLDVLRDDPDFFKSKGVECFVSNERSGAYLAWIYFYCDKIDIVEEVPDIIKEVDDFDRFALEIPTSKIFVKSLDIYNCDPSTKEGLKFWQDLFYDDIFASKWQDMIFIGEKYMMGLQKQWKNLREGALYISTITDADGNEHELAVMNADGYSDMFGDEYNKYDACCLWNLTKDGKYSYSLYSHDNLFNCKEFAERHNGGGHPGAAGFTIDKLLFLPNE